MSIETSTKTNCAPPLPPAPRKKRPTIAEAEAREKEIREEERAVFLHEKEATARQIEDKIVRQVALCALGSSWDVDTVDQLVSAVFKRQKEARVSGFIDALQAMEAPSYLTARMFGKGIIEVHGLLSLYRATVSDMNKQWEDKIAKAVAASDKAAEDPDAVEFQGKKWSLTDDEKAFVTCQKLDTVGGSGKISAIKSLRERTGLGLYESKQIVDAYCLKKGIK